MEPGLLKSDLQAGRRVTGLGGVHDHEGAILPAAVFESDVAITLRKQRVIATDADIGAGMVLSAALADQNVASDHQFTTKFFHTKTLGLRIATVAGATACFFVCHLYCAPGECSRTLTVCQALMPVIFNWVYHCR